MKLILLFVVFLLSNMLAFSQAIEVDSSGNVGINDSNPVDYGHGFKTLSVKGSSTTESGVVELKTSDASQRMFMYMFGSRGIIMTKTNHPIDIYTNDTVRMTIAASGNVGINDSNPVDYGFGFKTLSIKGSSATESGVVELKTSDASQRMFMYMFGSRGIIMTKTNHPIDIYTNDTVRMTIAASGNVGIGTIAPNYKFHLYSTGDHGNLVNEVASSSYISRFIASDGTPAGFLDYEHSTDDWVIRNNTLERMRITSLGNVAIGTSSFGTHHNKALGIYGDTHCSLKLMTSASGSTNNDGFEIGVQDKHGYIQNREVDGKICFHTNNTERVQISATGNVGIGTIAPNYKFHLYSTGDHGNLVNEVASSSYISRFIASDGTPAGFLDYEHSTDDWVIRNNTLERMRITSLGHVAIGTSSFGTHHNKTLGIYGDTHCSLKLMTSSSGTTNNDGFEIGVQNNHGYIQNREVDGKICFLTNNTERVQISATGNVGIGTTTPTEKLEVNGAVKATSFKVGGTTLNVPDYVFEEGYKLKTLDEVKALIAEHGHLPGVPSAKDINKNGLDMVGMQLKLLEKVEELTLYTIDQHKEIQMLKEENLKLKEKEALIETLLKRVEKLENK